MLDPYVYPSTDILKNILGIQERKLLDDAEADYVSLRLRELAESPLRGDYDFAHISGENNQRLLNKCYAMLGFRLCVCIVALFPSSVLLNRERKDYYSQCASSMMLIFLTNGSKQQRRRIQLKNLKV